MNGKKYLTLFPVLIYTLHYSFIDSMTFSWEVAKTSKADIFICEFERFF